MKYITTQVFLIPHLENRLSRGHNNNFIFSTPNSTKTLSFQESHSEQIRAYQLGLEVKIGTVFLIVILLRYYDLIYFEIYYFEDYIINIVN